MDIIVCMLLHIIILYAYSLHVHTNRLHDNGMYVCVYSHGCNLQAWDFDQYISMNACMHFTYILHAKYILFVRVYICYYVTECSGSCKT